MERQRVVVVVEDAPASRAALQWAVRNFIRAGDSIALLHVCAPARSKRRRRRLRLRGFQLALAFRDLCDGVAEAMVEIVVREGELAETVAAAVGQLRASTLVVGLHDKSFLYGSPGPYEGVGGLGCRVLAVRQHATARHGAVEAELTQVETIRLHVPPPKIPFPIFALPLGVIWRRSSSSKKRR
ncbi:uncharacterized protein LOC119266599 isoform X2 [Triticum dicoccoides]|uniref:UspA domain-containing protein n=1 Tax=Triticum turgidum subsp. durum TaxID=4567 RepID=A0A9R0VE44_TRITD|nr:uncharacterized protein LOC119266599 isoform X2 [Triticum dicoccoides]VAH55702.1 unnamed protein product [Triticum turgidum subsp. durum]